MFSTQKNSGVYKASTAQVVYNVVVPVYLNNRCINALRVNGNSAITLVDSRLVESHQIVSGETIQLRGAFDDNFVEKPVADVDLRSPHFACNKNIRVKVAVTALPDNLQYIIGNTLFTHYSHFQDTIKVTSHSLATYIRQSLTSACLLTTIVRAMFCEVARPKFNCTSIILFTERSSARVCSCRDSTSKNIQGYYTTEFPLYSSRSLLTLIKLLELS